MAPRKYQPDHTRVVGYIRVSTEEQANSGLGLAAQREKIITECERRGWTLVEIFEDAGISGKSVTARPGLALALAALDERRAGGIMVAKLDRLTRSLVDFANLMAQLQTAGWNLVALDLGIDLSTPSGEFMANVMASAAQWERRIISQRTKDALATLKANGAVLGRRSLVDRETVEAIVEARQDGLSFRAICKALNDDDIPTPLGGTEWRPNVVRGICLANMAAA